MTNLWVWKYALESATTLNSKANRRVYEGALVRLGSGFGCLHPWPELGDASLAECLADLAGPQNLPLVKRSLACIAQDAKAREEGRSLFEGLQVPPSHATIGGFDRGAVEQAAARGFTHLKVKAGSQIKRDLSQIRDAIREWPSLRWRIDFNENGNLDHFLREFREWSDEEMSAIDFLEDPLPYPRGGAESWSTLREATGLALANDRWVEKDDGSSEILVVKPAVNEMIRDPRVIVTTYLDHPLGQVFAAWEAAHAGVKNLCGLQTHGVFRKSDFTEILGEPGPKFRVPEGSGLGFIEALESLEWIKLNHERSS